MWRLLEFGRQQEARSLYRVDKYRIKFTFIAFAVLVLHQTIDLVLDLLGT